MFPGLETKRSPMSILTFVGSPQSRMLAVSALAVFVSLSTAAGWSADANLRGEIWIGTWATAPQPFMPGALQSFRNQDSAPLVHERWRRESPDHDFQYLWRPPIADRRGAHCEGHCRGKHRSYLRSNPEIRWTNVRYNSSTINGGERSCGFGGASVV
jgi:hypothetical protein